MKVYLVWLCGCSSSYIVGVFDSKEQAEAIAADSRGIEDFTVSELELNAPPNLPPAADKYTTILDLVTGKLEQLPAYRERVRGEDPCIPFQIDFEIRGKYGASRYRYFDSYVSHKESDRLANVYYRGFQDYTINNVDRDTLYEGK